MFSAVNSIHTHQCSSSSASLSILLRKNNKIALTELVNGLVLLMLPIYFNALKRYWVSLAICEWEFVLNRRRRGRCNHKILRSQNYRFIPTPPVSKIWFRKYSSYDRQFSSWSGQAIKKDLLELIIFLHTSLNLLKNS